LPLSFPEEYESSFHFLLENGFCWMKFAFSK
jgi:hypothetical protein